MDVEQPLLEDGSPALRKKTCRRPLLFLLLLCLLGILYGLNLTDTSSTWTEQMWRSYFNSTAAGNSNQTDRESPLTRLLPNLIGKRTKTVTIRDGTTSTSPLSSDQPTAGCKRTTAGKLLTESKMATAKSPPEYKSPGPYLVEYPYKYNFIIDEAEACREVKPFLVLIVPVAPQNKADRQVIRDTWGARKVLSGLNVALFFLLGLGKADDKELREESEQNRDILQSDFIDCYKNLTIKTMVMLEWLDSRCRDASYAMKIDSDMFLNVPRLLEMLQGQPKADYLTGLVERAAPVHRWPSKWFVPMEIFSEDRYPPYVLGLGYVFSLDLPAKLVGASREVRALYIEDVYLGMCLRRLGLQPTEPPLHGAFHVFPMGYDRCLYSRLIATTLSEHTDRRQLWRDFSRAEPHC